VRAGTSPGEGDALVGHGVTALGVGDDLVDLKLYQEDLGLAASTTATVVVE
jgi:hypothetical protein